jgi:hypothetical protein
LADIMASELRSGRRPTQLGAEHAALMGTAPDLLVRTTRGWMHPDKLTILMVGDADKVLPLLKEAGFEQEVKLIKLDELIENGKH